MEPGRLALALAWLKRMRKDDAAKEKLRIEHEMWMFATLRAEIHNTMKPKKPWPYPEHPHAKKTRVSAAELERQRERNADERR